MGKFDKKLININSLITSNDKLIINGIINSSLPVKENNFVCTNNMKDYKINFISENYINSFKDDNLYYSFNFECVIKLEDNNKQNIIKFLFNKNVCIINYLNSSCKFKNYFKLYKYDRYFVISKPNIKRTIKKIIKKVKNKKAF